MLIRDERISEEQLDRAIEVQRHEGGKLGSVLVELGFLDVETVTVYLGLELGIPIANGATLERCKRSAVRLLTPRQARTLRCVPIVIQGQTLVVAIDDPHDLVTLDELSAITGYRVLPRVAPEIRVQYYLERFYGIPRPERFARLGNTVRGSRAPRSDLPPPPLPGLPSFRKPQAPATAQPVIERLRRVSEKPDDDADEILELDVADLIVELDADETEGADVASEVAGQPEKKARLPARPTEFAPAELDEAVALTREATTRDQVARAILRYATGVFDVTAIFMIRDNMAFGWKAAADGIHKGRVELILVPLSAPSVLQVAVASEDVYHGPVFPSTVHTYLYRALRNPAPALATVAVVAIGDRPVNIIYGHRYDGEEPELAALSQLGRAAAEAYVRLISGRKRAAPDNG